MTLKHGFELLVERFIPELNTLARLYRHQRTAAQLLSLENDDENKVFCITFRTPPTDSTGVAHIMEHAVLCGSEKYPLKEPFVELVKGSLNTFLNAFTYPDKTCYPVASQNLKDFYNLIDVYMDAVFHPLIPPHILQQEGWHYELEDIAAPLTYKGVVFNEMKGVFSNPDELLARYARASLFPDNPYGFESGGDPRVIPDLTYEQFKAFHDRFYHPSNARICFYGDDDPEERLRLMDRYLAGYQELEVDSAIPLQPAFDGPRKQVVNFDPGQEKSGRRGMLVMNWLLDSNRDPAWMLGLTILNHILIGTPAAPLRKALIDSGLGEDLTGGGLESELLQPYFSVGLKGMAVDQNDRLLEGERLENLILDNLRSLAENGIDPATVEASLNTIEFRLRENNTGAFPRGLLLILRSLAYWLYDEDPLAPLAYEAPLNEIKKHLAEGEPYFENQIRSVFLNNHHRTTVILQPEPGLAEKQEQDERTRLENIRAFLSEQDLLAIAENTHRLKIIQETPDSPEALATIPVLTLNDLEPENKRIPLEVSQIHETKLLYHDLFTNGILYLDLGFDLHSLPQDLLPYVPLFGRTLLEIGTEQEDFVRLSQRIGRSTGGIRTTTFTALERLARRSTAWLFLRGKSTVPQAGELLKILEDILLTARLDNRERFRQMVLEEKAGAEAALIPGGHRVVYSRLRAAFNEADWADEQMNGLSNLFFLRQLAQAVDQDWPAVLSKLEAVRRGLVNRSCMIGNVTLDQTNWLKVQPLLEAFLDALPASQASMPLWQPQPAPACEGLTIPAHVNYVGKGADLYQLGYQLHGSVNVITKYLNTTWLWERVRVQGGAYGAFSLFNHRTGVYASVSYRDPNLLSTLENYDQTGQFLRQLDLTQEELTKSIIGAIGDMDAYQLPDAKGFTSMTRYLAGETDEQRQLWRKQVLSTRAADFHAFGEILEIARQQSHVVVLGSPESIQKANAEREGWLEVRQVL